MNRHLFLICGQIKLNVIEDLRIFKLNKRVDGDGKNNYCATCNSLDTRPSIETITGGAVIIFTIAIHSFIKLKNS